MRNIKITFRLTPYQLARGLQVMKQLDPNYELISLASMVKTIYHDYLAKMTLNKASAIDQTLVAEINKHLNTINEKLTVENLFLANETKSAKLLDPPDPEIEEDPYDPDEELSEETLAEIEQMVAQTKKFSSLRKASEFDDPNKTESEISTLTDFSPPKDWKE
jgi:hypothetical protein